MTDKPRTIVFFVNHGAMWANIERFFRSEAGAEFWRELTEAAAKYAPKIKDIRWGFDSVYLPPDAAEPFIDRLEEIDEENFDGQDDPLLEGEFPIQWYETNRPNALQEWAEEELQAWKRGER